ncbi:unnamed protein product, partial [Prorocentrum cordatum]
RRPRPASWRDLLPLGACAVRGAAWPGPAALMDEGCDKGVALVSTADGAAAPPIMGVFPSEVPGILELWAPGNSTPIGPGETVPAGRELAVRYSGWHAEQGGAHVAYAVSSGELAGSRRCGDGGARLLATSRGTPFIYRASWRPGPAPGPATVALGVAHSSLGTPSVLVARLRVVVGPAAGEGGDAEARRPEAAPEPRAGS